MHQVTYEVCALLVAIAAVLGVGIGLGLAHLFPSLVLPKSIDRDWQAWKQERSDDMEWSEEADEIVEAVERGEER